MNRDTLTTFEAQAYLKDEHGIEVMRRTIHKWFRQYKPGQYGIKAYRREYGPMWLVQKADIDEAVAAGLVPGKAGRPRIWRKPDGQK